MTTATELIGKRVTVLGTVATVVGVANVQKNNVVFPDESICVLDDDHGNRFHVLTRVIDVLPETIRRDSFVYCP